jgi:hypothetical protein
MSTASGIAGQFGYAAETTWATYKTPDHFVEVVSESMKLSIDRIESQGIRAGDRVLRTNRYVAGKKQTAGSLSFEVASKGFGLLFKHALGSIATTTAAGGTNAKKHSATLGDPLGLGLTMQIGRPDNTGTVQPFSYTGLKIVSAEWTNSVDQLLMFNADVDGQGESTSQSLASASYASSDELLSFVGGSVSVAGSTVATVHDFSVKVATGLKSDRFYLGAASKAEQLQNALVAITGTLTMEFAGLTAYNRFVNNTQAAVTASWAGFTALEGAIMPSLTITLPNCRFDGETPNLSGHDMLAQQISFVALYDGSTAPITVDYVSLDATP